MEIRLFITAFLLVLVAFHVCAEQEKKEVEQEVEKRFNPAVLGKRGEKRFDPAMLGKRGEKRQDGAWMGKRQDRGGKRQDVAWMGKRLLDRGGKRQDGAWMGKRQDRGGKRQDGAWMGKRQDGLAWMGKRDDPRTSCRTEYFPSLGKWKYVCPNDARRTTSDEELQKELDAFFGRFGR